MKTSLYQYAKLEVLSVVDLARDAIHIHIGMIAFIGWIVVFKKPINAFKSLIPVLFVVFAMEGFDLRDDYLAFGYFRWSASFHDIFNSLFWPLILVIFSKAYLIRIK